MKKPLFFSLAAIYLEKLKLKDQMMVLIGIAIIMMTVTQVFFYIRFRNLTLERAEYYVESLVNQVAEQLYSKARNMEHSGFTVAYNRHVQEYFITDDPERKYIILFPFVRDILEYVRSSNDDIFDIILADAEGNIITSLLGAFVYQYNMQQILIQQYEVNSANFRVPIHTSLIKDVDGTNFLAYILPIYSTQLGINYLQRIGSCTVISNAESLNRIIMDIALSDNSSFLILDSQNTVIAGNRREEHGQSFAGIYPFSIDTITLDKTITDNQMNTIIQYHRLGSSGWNVLSIIPEGELSEDLLSIRRFGLLLGFIMIVLLIISAAVFIKSITLPVSRLIGFLEGVGKDDAKRRLKMPMPNEIGVIAGYVNSMLDKIEDDTDKLLKTQKQYHEAELLKKQMEYSSLQGQINPHFLYNTINCISSIAMVNDIKEIVTISEAMVRIFRYSIKQTELVTVRDEIELIRDYMDIMNIRYPGRFTLEISVDETIMNYSTIRMILQPLAENAVYHGLEPKQGPGTLLISAALSTEDTFAISIDDNGIGIEKAELEKLHETLDAEDTGEREKPENKMGIGIKNIHRRIRLMFGSEYGIRLYSKQDHGTCVRISLPLIKPD